MARPARTVVVLGLLAGLVLALVRALSREARRSPAALAAPPASLPAITPVDRTPVPVAIAPPAPSPGDGEAWVAAVDGGCPDDYPIKAKVGSGIYHRPGGASYARTRPDRCYRDEAAAEADGFRAAKR